MKIHRTKLSQADDLYNNHIGKLLSPPYEDETFAEYFDRVEKEVKR